MSGGVGKRFGARIPKQYAYVNGRPIIDYVVDAVNSSKKCDKVICVIDKQYINLSKKLSENKFDYVDNGTSRLESVKNGLDYIKENFPCKKIVIVDAVAPFLYGELIDDYFDKLDNFNCVITGQHITGALSDFENNDYDRDRFVITQSPEAYRFDEFYEAFDVNYQYQEMAGMLGKDIKRYYNFDFKNNIKLTYDFELKYIETMFNYYDSKNRQNNTLLLEKELLYTIGINKYLLRTQNSETSKWIDTIYNLFPIIVDKYRILSININQTSMYGLVIEATSSVYGEIVLKFIPEFVNRYNKEKEAYKLLSNEYMCDTIDFDDEYGLIVERKISNAKYATFEDNIQLTDFFNKVKNSAKLSTNAGTHFIQPYYDELVYKLNNAHKIPFMKDEIGNELKKSKELYDKLFKDEKKYILHGDLHPFNMLFDGKAIFAIDPNGTLAPLVFEYVTFIRNDVRDHKSFGYLNRFNLLIDYFSSFAKKEELIAAFLIHMAYTNYNSTFEYCDDTLTKINSEIFNSVFQEYY